MSAARRTRATHAIAALISAKLWHQVYEYDHDSNAQSFGHEAVERLGVDPQRLYKTLVLTTSEQWIANAVVAVADQLHFKRVSTALGVKSVRMADAAVAQRKTGYVLGGISPVGQKSDVPTIIDESVHDHDTIWVSGGRRGLSVEVRVPDLLQLTKARVAPIRR